MPNVNIEIRPSIALAVFAFIIGGLAHFIFWPLFFIFLAIGAIVVQKTLWGLVAFGIAVIFAVVALNAETEWLLKLLNIQ